MTDKKENPRKKWAELVAGIKGALSKREEELDEAGIEKKAMDIMPETVDDLRNNLCTAFPAMCEGEGEAVAEVMQVIVDTLAEAQPESDVAEERAEDGEEDKQDEEEEEEKNSVVAALTQQVADMGKAYNELGKAYNELAEDVSEVVQLTHKAFVAMDAETKSYSDFEKRMADMEKKIGERPRRASQSPETELDPESKLAESLKQRNLSDVPEPFQEMFKPEGATS